jgi:uncharacterized iron-regulated membrane protein
MNGTFRQSMAWLHTWSGLVVGWVLYMMFLTGTASFFQDEISVWMRPELGRYAEPATAIERAAQRLQELAPNAATWTITPPDQRDPSTQISWRAAEGEPAASPLLLDSRTGEPVAVRDTRGGDFFYRLHYRFEIPGRNGWWFSGAAAMIMLIGILSGVIIHKRIFKDFFTFRPRSSAQRSWLDVHNVLAVIALPFHIVITYTGLVPIMTTVMPWAVVSSYAEHRSVPEALADFDALRSAYSAERAAAVPQSERSGVAAPLAPLGPILAAAHERWESGRIGRVIVSNPGDRGAIVEVVRHVGDEISYRPERMFFAGTTGAFLTSFDDRGATDETRSVLYGLHIGRFADPLLRWLLFFMGIVSTAMIATGLILWTVKRAEAAERPMTWSGHGVVSRLNVGTVAGLPIAMAALFWANRLLPLDVAERAALEVRMFFAVWIVALAYAALRPAKRAWTEELAVAAAAFAGLPLVNALTTERNLFVSLQTGDWVMASFDLAVTGFGVVLACAAWAVGRRAAPQPVAAPGAARAATLAGS